jgi:hypothetical protein
MDGMMIVKNELIRMWKELVMVSFKVLSWHLSIGTEESFKKHQSRQLVTGPRFEPGKLQSTIESDMVI